MSNRSTPSPGLASSGAAPYAHQYNGCSVVLVYPEIRGGGMGGGATLGPGARNARGLCVRAHGVVHAMAVATGDGDRDGDVHLATALEHESVAAREPLEGQLQPAKPIALVRICPGEIEHQIGLRCGEYPRERRRERVEVLVVA